MPELIREEPLGLLHTALARNRLAHAVLLNGPPGSDKLQIAHEIARAVLCPHRESGRACGECTSCQLMDRMIHPDVHWTLPIIGSKNSSGDFYENWREVFPSNPWLSLSDWLRAMDAENKEPNINVRECNEIIHVLGLTPQRGEHKVLIMWLPEYLGKEGNRLLKLIEEPPPNTFLFFVAEDTGQILNTILSRCEIIKVPPFDDEQIEEYLMKARDLSPDRALECAKLADGNMDEAIRLSQGRGESVSEAFVQWMRVCYIARPKALVEWVDETSKQDRDWQKQLFRYGLHFLRELLQMRSGREQIRLTEREEQTASNFSGQLKPGALELMSDLFNDGLMAIERNAHRKTLFLSSCLRLKDIFRRK